MYVRLRRTRIEIWTPAKLNLYLELLGRRADGYHELETLMVPISLFDTLRMSPRLDGRIELKASWASPSGTADSGEFSGLGELPPPEQNLVYRAVARLRNRAGIRDGLNIELLKRIPAAAGLGGGSSDAAAALWGANLLWRLNWTAEQLAEVGGELGSDVPFFVHLVPHGGAALCSGRGEHVQAFELRIQPWFVLLRPPQGLATADVYAHSRLDAVPRRMADGWSAGRLRSAGQLARGMFNRLQSAAAELAPWLSNVQRQFQRLELLGHQLSGSGSTYFGICRSARQACRAAATLRSRCEGHVFCARAVVGGPRHLVAASQT